jgi:hypothetical protein
MKKKQQKRNKYIVTRNKKKDNDTFLSGPCGVGQIGCPKLDTSIQIQFK